MRQSVTLEIVGAMAEQLPPEDQRKLVEQIRERVSQHENYSAQVANFLKMCRDSTLPGDDRDADEAIRAIREERGDQLCKNDV